MYFLFGIFLIVCILFLCIQQYRKSSIIHKIRCMDACRKNCLLDNILSPFGFSYQSQGDLIVTRADAWQRGFGYQELFDKSALHFQMVFDCEPVYFYYKGRTYLVEFWKGQYGVAIGGEAGFFYTDGILLPEQFSNAGFKAVSDEEFFRVQMSLYHKGHRVFECSKRQWWVGGFRVGAYCEPENVMMRLSVTFPEREMLLQFVKSLLNSGYDAGEISICDATVSFVCSIPHSRQPRIAHRFLSAFSQWKNRRFTRLFCRVTKPFVCTSDRLLYLYFFLPFVFRRIVTYKKSRKQKWKRNKKGGV